MKKYFAFAAVATMFAACTNEEVTPQVDALTGMPIQVKTNVASLVDSRVAGMDSEADFSTFYLNIAGDTEYFATMTKGDDDKWSSETEMVWTNGNAVTISAIMPGSFTWDSDYYNKGKSVQVLKGQSDDGTYKNSDMLYMAPTNVTPDSDGSITVNFNHLMSKVRIAIVTGSSEDSDPVSSVKVGGTCLYRTFVPVTGTWGDVVSSTNWDITAHSDSYKEGTSVYEVILVPQDVAANTFSVSFTMGEKDYKWTASEAVTLESGKLYTLDLQVPDNDPTGDAVIVSVNVAPWPTEPVVLGGSNNDAVVVE